MSAAQLADAPSDGGRAGEPDLVDEPRFECVGQSVEGGRAVGVHDVHHVARDAAAARSSAGERRGDAGVDSDGFQTTALPHSRAGTRYQDGTATGKFPAVTIAATPTGRGT